MDARSLLEHCEGFDWDKHNRFKSWLKHEVTPEECEQIFFNQPLVIAEDEKHSDREARLFCLGKTDQHRQIFVVFTIRNKHIRVISARDMSRKERTVYEKAPKV